MANKWGKANTALVSVICLLFLINIGLGFYLIFKKG